MGIDTPVTAVEEILFLFGTFCLLLYGDVTLICYDLYTVERTMTEEDAEDIEMTEGTDNTNYRWAGLSTVLGMAVGLSFPAIVTLHAYAYIDIATIPQEWRYAYILGWFVILIYTFGEDSVKALKEIR